MLFSTMTYDLNQVLITPRIQMSWLTYIHLAKVDILKKYPDIQAHEIPDEQFRTLPGGNGEIFVKIRGVELKMRVPKNEFSIHDNTISN